MIPGMRLRPAPMAGKFLMYCTETGLTVSSTAVPEPDGGVWRPEKERHYGDDQTGIQGYCPLSAVRRARVLCADVDPCRWSRLAVAGV